jgi:SPOR domain
MNFKTIILSAVFCQFILASLPAQISGELKQFLWQKNFSELIENYAEEKITLRDEGVWQKQISARSYREEQGLRVQLFAGAIEENARTAAAEIQSLSLDSVYVLEEDGLFKVQLGNFQERLAAEKMLDQLRFKGITNAWIVQTTIHVPKVSVDQVLTPGTKTDSSEYSPLIFTIQVFVTRDLTNAERVLQSLSDQVKQEGWVICSGDLWKVVVGNFQTEAAAREFLSVLRSSGFPDAWLTQINYNRE